MRPLLTKLLPIAIGLCVFLAISAAVQHYEPSIQTLISGSSTWLAMSLYVILGIVTVAVPFLSLIPFIPLAVTLWGWIPTTLLTILSWTIGGQILFLAARWFGRPVIERYFASSQLDSVREMISGKGLLPSIIVRMFVHMDSISFAFAIFTHISAWHFLIVTAAGVTPPAIAYALFGSLPLSWQAAAGVCGLVLLAIYWSTHKANTARMGKPDKSAKTPQKA